MPHAMDREKFDEVIDAISQIQGKTIKLERALRLLKSKPRISDLDISITKRLGMRRSAGKRQSKE